MLNPIITPPRVPLVDLRTGVIDRAWYLFLLSLNRSSSDNTLTLDDLQKSPPIIPPETFTNYLEQPSNIAITSSPFTYINTTGYPADIIVSGGGVVLLEFSRNGVTFFSTGSFYGMFTLSPYDQLRVTYETQPQMTLVPR
jgi:hypothetical protein